MSQQLANFVWGIADQIRGVYKPAQYGQVILPFTVLRRMECVMNGHRPELVELAAKVPNEAALAAKLRRDYGLHFWNTSSWTLKTLLGDPESLADNLIDYVSAFSANVADIFAEFGFEKTIRKLDENDRLYLVVDAFADDEKVDLHPSALSNAGMGQLFEHLIYKFSTASNETAGEHFTPRDAIRLMVDLLLAPDSDVLSVPGTVRTIYDPTAGTGGMLSVAEERILAMNPRAKVMLAGQELNPESYAMCKADMIGKGQDVNAIRRGDTLKNDLHWGSHFDYCLSNPPYGGDWKSAEESVRKETALAFQGRFGAGLPRISDGQMLFLQHLVSKMRPAVAGSDSSGGRAGIVLNGSPLFTGGAGSGESSIRQWLIESDLVDAIISLPTNMFYNTGLSTCIWILDNNKGVQRRGKVLLINGAAFGTRMQRNLGSKNTQLLPADRRRILKLYDEFGNSEHSRVMDATDLGYWEVIVEQPLRLRFQLDSRMVDAVIATKAVDKLDEAHRTALKRALVSLGEKVWLSRDQFIKDLRNSLTAQQVALGLPTLKAIWQTVGIRDPAAEIIRTARGVPEPDPLLRTTEIVPFREDIDTFFQREVLPNHPDAWVDEAATRVGYEIPFTRIFYTARKLRSPAAVGQDIRVLLRDSAGFSALTREWSDRESMSGASQGFFNHIPDTWQRVRLGSVFRERRTTVSDQDYPALSVTMDGVVPQLAHVAKTADNDNRKLVRAGDIVINSRSDRRGSCGRAEQDGSVSIISTVLEPVGIDSRFAHHLLRSVPFQEEFYRWGHGIVADLWSTRYSEMARITIPLPPRPEQVALADELDALDQVVKLAGQFAVLAKEQRDALTARLAFGDPGRRRA